MSADQAVGRAEGRPFRFGAQASKADDGAAWADLARRLEDDGFDTMSMPDHLGPQLAPLSALGYASAGTTTLRFTMSVLDNDFRHPAILAKELATLDLLSGGRVEVGLGAGWMHQDYTSTGIGFDPAAVRIDRLAEAVSVVRGLLSPGPFSFTGRHYRIDELEGYPQPVQQPVPLMVGGGGRRVLTLATEVADIVGVALRNPTGVRFPANAADASRASFARKVAVVKEAAARNGRHPEVCVRVLACEVSDDRRGTAERISRAWDVDTEMVEQSPYALIGSPDAIVEHVRAIAADFGATYFVSSLPAALQLAPVIARLR
jgi:probable F420-dependent oxidoreductase